MIPICIICNPNKSLLFWRNYFETETTDEEDENNLSEFKSIISELKICNKISSSNYSFCCSFSETFAFIYNPFTVQSFPEEQKKLCSNQYNHY